MHSVFASRMTSFALPTGYARIQTVNTFDELVTTRFCGGVNALCWPRTLSGDFAEVVEQLRLGDGVTPIDEARLRALPLSAAGRSAVDVLLEDQRLLRAHGLAPELNGIRGYPRDEDPAAVPIDVYSFHADSATVETDTYLCTYYGPASEALRNEDAQRHVDTPAVRAKLLEDFGGRDDGNFAEHLKENCFDLHYLAVGDAQPFSFGRGNLWRIAVEYPGSPVPPCVHRAPDTRPGDPPRLLLIS